jgi:hypothetical protein
MLKGLLISLLALPTSKKVLAAIIGFALAKLLPGLSEQNRLEIVALTVSVILGFAASDHGKEAAKINSNAAPVLESSVAQPGRNVIVDMDTPRGGKGDR